MASKKAAESVVKVVVAPEPATTTSRVRVVESKNSKQHKNHPRSAAMVRKKDFKGGKVVRHERVERPVKNFRKSVIWDPFVRRVLLDTRRVLADKAALLKLLSAEKEVYFKDDKVSDLKTTDQRVKFCDDQVLLLKQEMASAMRASGMNEFSIVLPRVLDTYRLATVTSGIVNNVLTILPSNPTEWTSCIALFEEYRMSALTVQTAELMYNVSTQAVPVASTLDNSQSISVADPADNTVLNSVFAGSQYAVKMFTYNPIGTFTTEGGRRGLNEWHIRFPRGQQFDNNGANMIAAQDEWLPINATITATPAYCYIKHYTVQAVVTAISVSSALMFYHLHFRSRQ